MQPRPVRQLAALVSLAGTLAAAALLAPAAQARTSVPAQSAEAARPVQSAAPSQPAPVAPDDDLLAEPERGRAAIEALGTDLPAAAALNGTEPRELRELLLEDRTAWIDPSGALFYKDPAPAQSDALPAPEGQYPYDQTFLLHSKPGSQRTIYLDFTGGTVSGSQWNASYPAMATSHPAWTVDTDATTFSAVERDAIQFVYQTVAEDYAPFDIDVTTQDPGAAALNRDSSSDTTYGSWALITPSTSASAAICGDACGGVAYVGSFNADASGRYQPAWVFPHRLQNSAKGIAEAASHEVGHNLGLEHDGKGAASYYSGQGAWAPIMGGSYQRPISQWSIGDYASPTNLQDDLSVMQATGAPLRADDHATGTSGASSLGTSAHGDGIISHRRDRDVFIARTSCTGTLTATATPAAVAPNLDIRLRLLDANGSPLQSADPPSAYVSGTSASGMGATLSRSVSAGTYFLEVDGAGMGDPLTTGYSDYGSLGAFGLDVTGCLSGSSVPLATAPTGVSATAGIGQATVGWTAPSNAAAAGVSQYRVRWFAGASATAAGSVVVASTERSLTRTGLTPGASYTFDVSAIGPAGTGAVSARSAPVTPTAAAVRPGEVQIGAAQAGVIGAAITATARWTRQSGTAVTGYRVTALRLGAGGRVLSRTVSAMQAPRRTSLSMGLPRRGTYAFTVQAFNQSLAGAPSAQSNRVAGR